MKIMQIVSGDKWAGAEVQVWTLCAQLVRQGHQVNAVVLNPGRLAEQLMAAGVTVTVLDETRFGFKTLLNKIKLELRRVQPDVVHTHRQKENILGSVANRLTVRARCFRTVHGAPEFTPSAKQRIQIALDTYCGRYLQHGVISVSDELTQKLAGRFSASRIHTIANGISTKDVQGDAANNKVEPVDENYVHIGFVGRLEPVKRVDLFIGTAAKLCEQRKPEDGKPLRFHIFGDGSLHATLVQQAQQAGISDNIVFHGHTHVVRSWISQMNFLLMPSDHEGLPMTALESLALGVPLVAHATGGLKPLLSEAFAAGLVSDHSVQGYTAQMQQVLDKPWSVSLPAAYSAATSAQHYCTLYAG